MRNQFANANVATMVSALEAQIATRSKPRASKRLEYRVIFQAERRNWLRFICKRQMGEQLARMPKNVGGNPNLPGTPEEPVARLREIGISKKASNRC